MGLFNIYALAEEVHLGTVTIGMSAANTTCYLLGLEMTPW